MKTLKKILYADNETDIGTIVEVTVQTMSDYEIQICTSTQEIFDCIEKHNPDLIIIDFSMFESGDTTTLQYLHSNERTKDIPIVLMMTKSQTENAELPENVGVIGTITKPFDPVNLCSDIETIWKNKYE